MSAFPFRDESLPLEKRVEDLIGRLTVEEKVFQLTHDAASIPRLGIRSYVYWNEALHGVARAGVATVFPQAIGMGATFDPAFLREVADVISTEGRAKYNEFQRQGDCGIYKGLTYWSPNVNIFRDPRWGRGHETYGEDPYLTGRMGVAFIQGLQGDDPKHLKSAACAKHFAVHSGPEADRHHFNAVVSRRDMFDTYLPAFEECVKEGRVESVMGAYNAVNGEPSNASDVLLTEILRQRWGFKGHVVSDCGAINDLHSNYHVTNTVAESAALGIKKGCDLNCGGVYKHLLTSYNEGLIEEADLDRALRRVLRARFKLGMFDAPENVAYSGIPYDEVASKAHKRLAREAARRSLVLLKNDGVLPLKSKATRLAVVGPNADSKLALLGNYNGTPSESYTVLEGLRKYLGEDAPIIYAEGCPIVDDRDDRFAEAVAAAQHSDVVICCLGLDSKWEGEAGDANNIYGSGDKPHIDLPVPQQKLLEKMIATGKPVIVLLLVGSAMAVRTADESAAAVVQCFYPGEQGGLAIADLLYGEYAPSGRLPVTLYKTSEELPDFADYAMAGRTYRYMQNEALYPFGYGLSYVDFDYAVDAAPITAATGDAVTVKVTVRNTGGMTAREPVQGYVKAESPSVIAPRWALKALETVEIPAGESREIALTFPPKAFSLIDEEGNRFVEPGRYTVYIGGQQPDSRSAALTGKTDTAVTVTLTGHKITLEN
ncbi:MAG: glycoside hydrolase family 3 C-terminal domain-containing protein [Acutalibacteraceae bacterium]|jgi:beta-glucosidase